MNISHNERRAHFHTFLLLYLFVFIMPDPLFASCLALPCAPMLPVLPGYVPVALLAPFRDRRWARRWQRGAGTATKGSIESSSKGRGGRQVASEHRAGRQRARNNESSAEHKHSPLSPDLPRVTPGLPRFYLPMSLKWYWRLHVQNEEQFLRERR